MAALTREETEALIQEVLEVYPEQARKDRAKHLAVNDQSLEKSNKCITSNRKSLARRYDHSWLCLRRFQGCGLGPD